MKKIIFILVTFSFIIITTSFAVASNTKNMLPGHEEPLRKSDVERSFISET